MKNIILFVKQKTTGLVNSDCYHRSIACSVTLVTGCANIAQRRCNRHSSPLYKKTTRQSGCWWRQQDSSTAIVTEGQSRAVRPWSQVAQTLRKGDVIAIRVRCIKKQPDNRVVGGDNRTRQQRLLPKVNRVQCDLGHRLRKHCAKAM